MNKRRSPTIPTFAKHWPGRKDWYHQRFDGSPMYLFTIADAEVLPEKRKPRGTEARDGRVSFFTADGKGDWYLSMDDIRRGSRVIIQLAKRNQKISSELMTHWTRDEKSFERFFWKFKPESLKRLTDRELLTLFQKYYKLSLLRFTSSSVIDHFALGTDEHIASLLRQELGKLGKESDFTSTFSIATAPTRQSFINQAEMELLTLALKLKPTTQELNQYQRKYFWIKNNYFSAHILTRKHFEQEIALWKKSGADLRAKYTQLKITPERNTKLKAKLFKRYKLSRLLKTLLKISDDFTWWQDERKKSTYLNIHLGTIILGEMAKRRGIDPELTRWLLPVEVESFFKRGLPNASELTTRSRGCAFIVWQTGYYVATGRQVETLRRLMFGAHKRDEVRDIRGLTASVGRVVGPVKIINSAREVSKVQKGDILVAVMTRPDYIAGIKQAAAVVTNEGGITCHAAIVSRELGIPCIIGTKIATEVLHDGDLVEVNANHGVVTKLR